MKSVDKQASTPIRSRTSIAERRYSPKAEDHSELRSWTHRTLLDAEKDQNFYKKDQFLSLLENLQNRPTMVSTMGVTRRKRIEKP